MEGNTINSRFPQTCGNLRMFPLAEEITTIGSNCATFFIDYELYSNNKTIYTSSYAIESKKKFVSLSSVRGFLLERLSAFLFIFHDRESRFQGVWGIPSCVFRGNYNKYNSCLTSICGTRVLLNMRYEARDGFVY